MIPLSMKNPLCINLYSCREEYQFSVGFGQCFGQNWIHVICEEPDSYNSLSSYVAMLDRALEHAQSMKETRFGAAYCQVYILQTHLSQLWILQTSCIIWKSSRVCGVKLEVFQDPGFCNVSGKWTSFDVNVRKFFLCTHIVVLLALALTIGNR